MTMDHAITVGMVVYGSLGVLGVMLVFGGIVWVLSVIASGFNH